MVDDSIEAQNTEELMRKILETHQRLGDVRSNKVAVGSMDVTTLYPSLDQITSAKMVKQEYIESDFKIDDIEWNSWSLYLA